MKTAFLTAALLAASSLGALAQTSAPPSGYQVTGPACYEQVHTGSGKIESRPVSCQGLRYTVRSLNQDHSKGPVQGVPGGGSN